MAESRIELPRPARGGWLIMLLVGVALLGLGAADVLAAGPRLLLSAPEEAASIREVLGYFAAGAGMFLASFSLVVLLNRETAARLELDEERGLLRVYDSRGADVAVALDAIASVRQMAGDSGSGTVVTLAKKDGGFIELFSVRDGEAARPVVDFVQAALQGDPPAAESLDAVDRLASVRGVRAERDGDALVVSWGARSSFKLLISVGCFLGMAVIGYGFLLNGQDLVIFFIGFALTLAFVMVAFSLISVGVTQRVRIDRRHLTVERVRLGRAIKSQQVPVFNVVTVDYTHQLNTHGAGISVRTGAGREAQQDALGDAAKGAEADDGMQVAMAVMKLVSSGIQLPTGQLSLASKLALELALGDEIARRSAKSAAHV
jgi:uncharacterized membrane protein